MNQAIEISVRDVTDMEAEVIARYVVDRPTDAAQSAAPVKLRGTVRGPFCEVARTLPAEFDFRSVQDQKAPHVVTAVAVVANPCLWSEELPHLYDVDVQATVEDRVIADYHGKIGLRRLAPRRPVDFAPGTG